MDVSFERLGLSVFIIETFVTIKFKGLIKFELNPGPFLLSCDFNVHIIKRVFVFTDKVFKVFAHKFVKLSVPDLIVKFEELGVCPEEVDTNDQQIQHGQLDYQQAYIDENQMQEYL